MRWASIISILAIVAGTLGSVTATAQEYTVYSVYRALNLGNPGEVSYKDFYVNMGRSQGVREGTVLEVMRRMPTFDQLNQKVYKEVVFPIAQLKVIHAESEASIARLQKMLPADQTPAISPRAVMVGDIVKIAGSR